MHLYIPLFEKLPDGRLVQVPQGKAEELRLQRRYTRHLIEADILQTPEEEQAHTHLVEQKYIKEARRRTEEKLLAGLLANSNSGPTS